MRLSIVDLDLIFLILYIVYAIVRYIRYVRWLHKHGKEFETEDEFERRNKDDSK